MSSKLNSSVYSHSTENWKIQEDGTHFDKDMGVEQVFSPDGTDFICNQEAWELLCQKFGKSVFKDSQRLGQFQQRIGCLADFVTRWVCCKSEDDQYCRDQQVLSKLA